VLAANVPTPTPFRLPPTWTPTATDTPHPTPTASPTVTLTPTLSAKDICDAFSIALAPAPNSLYEVAGVATFAWHGVTAEAPMSLSITLHGAIEGIRADSITDSDGLLPIQLTALAKPGQYDWKIWLNHPVYGQICTYSGTFVRLPFKII